MATDLDFSDNRVAFLLCALRMIAGGEGSHARMAQIALLEFAKVYDDQPEWHEFVRSTPGNRSESIRGFSAQLRSPAGRSEEVESESRE